jgi:hypothetical protein
MLRHTHSSRSIVSLMVLALVGLLSTPLLADDKPMTSTPPSQSSLPIGQSYSRNGNDWPGSEVRDWVMGATDAARTRTLFRQADSAMDAGYRRAQAHFENSREYQDAMADEEKAFADYSAAREKAMASLNDNSRYHEILRLRDEMGAQLDAFRADKHADKIQMAALASLKMQYASDAHAIEAQAIDSNADVKSARDRMVAAGRKAIAMRASFNDSLHDDAQLVQLRKNKEDARVAMITADAFTTAAGVAASVAVWYDTYLHRMDQGYYAPYGPGAVVGYGGYGSTGGYYSPYWGR